MKTRIIIHVDSGIVQGIYSDNPIPEDMRFYLCDTDVDGETPESDNHLQYMQDGSVAFFSAIKVERLSEKGVAELTPEGTQRP